MQAETAVPDTGLGGVTSEDAAPDKAKILIVDDDERNLTALQVILEELGEELVFTRSGEEALRYLLHNECALILMDVLMPGMDGYETADLVRSRERSRHIPIIFLTAVSRNEVHEFKGYTAGAVDYVFKPIEPFILRSKVAVFVDLYKKTREISHKVEQERRLLLENQQAQASRLAAEMALLRVEEGQALILRSLPIALYSMPADAPFQARLKIGETVRGPSGFAAEHFLEPGFWFDRIHPDDQTQVRQLFERLPETGSAVTEYRWLCADGASRYFLNHAVYIARGDGTAPEIVGSWLDVSDRRMLEQQAVHGQKMDSLGRLTGGIAHDFNNMLTVVISSLDRMRRTADPGNPVLRNIDLALTGALRCADLTKRLLSFARHQQLEPRPLDLNTLVGDTEVILRRLISDTIFLDVLRAPDLWPVYADPIQLESALVNLAVNSRDAMPEGGHLTVETRNIAIRTATGSDVPAGDYVSLSVTDTGIGIPPAHIDKVFEPFFTAKEVGKGTGLGLSIIYSFVRQSGGYIRLSSTVGKGTTIQILLPRLLAALEPQAEPGIPADMPKAQAGERILVVEDDPAVRVSVSAFLHDLGYAVLEARNGDEAVATLQGARDITLIFSDIAMPGSFNGYQLAAEVSAQYPQLPILLTSANAAGVPNSAQPATEWPFLQKPYRNTDLAVAIRQTISEKQRARPGN
ncbi:response regulator [Ferrovibrio terrae]|uniref:histidine kinase n=1 Tax=Ferrovibrio terrae TaxID=2594003 RepID=A0A516H182_9PROT|nr:response regulator [Ferrovibrio terrae]QDO97524.1 response regulator [Ferrovibrio terrae]